jgi:hypothetical protein
MLQKIITGFFICIFFNWALYAQDRLSVKFGKLTPADFNIQSPLIDVNTGAIIVGNTGSSHFSPNTSQTNNISFSLIFKEKKRIKILTKQGLDAATVVIPLYVGNDGTAERLEGLEAYTYNLRNGRVVETKLEKTAVYTEKANGNYIYKKFTFPSATEGSIIEYAYQVKSDYYFSLRPWQFQSKYPTLWSEYNIAVPEFFRYITINSGYNEFAVNKTERQLASFEFRTDNDAFDGKKTVTNSMYEVFKLKGMVNYHTWVMRNVKPLKEEPFVAAVENGRSKISFQLQEVSFPYPALYYKSYMDSWEQTSEDLLQDENFGLPINRSNNWLDEYLVPVVNQTLSPLEKTKRLYAYVRDRFTCTGRNSYLLQQSLKNVMHEQAGSAAEINLLLIAMLKRQGIEAAPVLLGTRDNGYVNESYPLLDRYNYVVAHVSIDSIAYYLDAAAPGLAFNKMPLLTYNGQARIINKEASPVYFIADSIIEKSETNIVIVNSNNKPVGNYSMQPGYYTSLQLRNSIKEDGLESCLNNLQLNWPDDIHFLNTQFDSLNDLQEPVSMKMQFQLNGFNGAEVVYFAPMLGNSVIKNPFAATERYFPVELATASDDVYSLSMEIPSGYKVEELPKPARIVLNGEEGLFEYFITADDALIQVRSRLTINKAVFFQDDYQSLRDFYAFVVKKQAEQIVFKKIK